MKANKPTVNEIGKWSVVPDSGIVFSNVNAYNAIVTGLAKSKVYTFKWRVSNPCGEDSSYMTITTSNQMGPPTANAGGDICLNSGTTSTTLAGNNPGPASGKWIKISGAAVSFVRDTLYNTVINGLSTGNYLLEWSNTRGTCDATRDTMMITVSGPATVANAGADVDSCGASVTLNGNTIITGIGKWSQVSGPGGWSISNASNPKARLTALTPGVYVFRWSVTNGACAGNFDDVRIRTSNVPTPALAGNSQKLCGGSSLTLNGNRITNGRGYWTLLNPSPNTPNVVDPDSGITNVTGLITGIYNFRYTSTTDAFCPNSTSDVSDTVVQKANAGADQSLCSATSAILTGNAGSVGTWSKVFGGTATLTAVPPNSAVASALNTAGSPYRFQYTVPTRWGCPASVDTMQVNVADSTVVPLAGPDQDLCNVSSFTLTANNVAPNTGTWSIVAAPAGNASTFSNPNSNTSTVNNVKTGTYIFRWTTSNGTCSRGDEIRIVNSPLPTKANAGPDATICPTTYKMKGNKAVSGIGTWTQLSGPASTIASPNDSFSMITGLTQATYSYAWTISSGICPVKTDTMIINIPNLNPTIANAGIDSIICNRTATKLNGNSPSIGTGTWTKASGPAATIAGPSSPNSNLTLTTAGAYKLAWTIVNGICKSTDTTVYTMYALPTTANAGKDTNICLFTPLILYGNNPSIGAGSWRYISGISTVTFVDSTKFNTAPLGLDTGNYVLRWVTKNGNCPVSSDDVKIRMIRQPDFASAGSNQILCQPFTTLIGSTNTVGKVLWAQKSGPSASTIATPNASTTAVSGLVNTPTNVYTYRYITQNEKCINKDSITVTYLKPTTTDNCSSARIILKTSGPVTDSLCATTAQVGEPMSCGKNACNSTWYTFVTNASTWYQPLNIDFTSLSNSVNGLRVSLFNTGGASCPTTLSPQFGSCQTVTSPTVLTWTGLAPSTQYFMVIDENAAICGNSKAKYTFQTSGNALPIEMLSFTARALDQNQSILNWETVTELNNKGFEVERKAEGEAEFKKIGFVAGAGNSNANLKYSYLDNITEVRPGLIFYRLKQVDFNGQSSYSSIATIRKAEGPISNPKLYPNPTNGSIVLELNAKEESNGTVVITDNIGKVVYSSSITVAEGFNSTPLSLTDMADGVYFVTFRTGEYTYSQKVMLIK
ncbi:MAG: T9SS type A sorting domain-containing protein [Bacteroidia bacterium]|nr:T9SS type A sorting domain-containing protein [Bacteroidia bacterium]